MRRVLAVLMIVALLGVPAMGKGLRIFQPPSPKRMVKPPHFPSKEAPGAAYAGAQKSGLLHRK